MSRFRSSSFLEFLQRAVNIRDYGAIGDGVHDDTNAIQRALNAAAGEAPVYAPPTLKGTPYMTSGPLSFGGATSLIGCGMFGATIKLANSSNCSMVTTPNDGTVRQGVRIADLCFDGNAANQTSGDSVIDIYSCDYVTIERNYIKNPYGNGVHVGAVPSNNHISVLPKIRENLIYGDSTGKSTGTGILLESSSSDGMVHDNDIGRFSNGKGVVLSGHNGAFMHHNNAWQCLIGYQIYSSARLRAVGNLADLAKQHGFVIQQSQQIHLMNCQAKDSSQQTANSYNGFYLQGISTELNEYVTLTGCEAFGSQAGAISLADYNNGIRVIGGDYSQSSGGLYVGTNNTDYEVIGAKGINRQGFTLATPALPSSVGLANAVQNTTGTSVRIYHTGQAGTHIVDLSGNDKVLPSESAEVTLDSGCKIYYATTLPTSWLWYGV